MIIISSGSLYSYGLNRFFCLAKKAGFLGVEIIINDIWDTRQAVYLKELQKKYSLKIFAFHAPFIKVKAWQSAQGKFFNSLQLAEALGAESLIVHPYDEDDNDFLRWLSRNLGHMQKKAKVKICIENLPKKYDEKGKVIYPGLDPEKLLNFDYLCLDTTHLATTSLDLLTVYQKIKHKLAHIHLSDALLFKSLGPDEEDEHLFLGEGHLALKELLSRTKKDSFKGLISLELRPEVLNEGDEKKVIKRLEKARQFMERAIL